MWDESDESEEIVCLECGERTEVACGHHLAFIDMTLGGCVGGEAFDYWDGYQSMASDALSLCAASGLQPQWARDEVSDLWDRCQEESKDFGYFVVAAGPFNDFMVSVLEEAGGTEHPGSVCSSSGAYCESRMRLLFAKHPKQVCEKAKEVLAEWLKPLPPGSENNDRSH